MIAALCSQNI